MKVLITGGTGMVGMAFNSLKTEHELVLVGSKDANLTSPAEAIELLREIDPDCIVHLAAKVGGVKGNMDNMADFYEENTLINVNVLRSARLLSLEKKKDIKLVSLLSTCIYPDKVNYPLTVDQIHDGPPHESNFGYAYAKRMLDIHAKAVAKQYGLRWVSAVPNNIYGEYDNFSLEDSHVIPAIIRKVYEGKKSGKPIILWGNGTALREFTYSKDIAESLIWMVDNYESQVPLNIGNTREYTIADVARQVCSILDYPFSNIEWDVTKPTGQLKKPSDNSEFLKICNNFDYTELKDGLEKTCRWFCEQYPNVRGV